ncbi:hypothetical protein MCFN_02755 [Mycoplasmopsis californica]|uniref:Uncharacterized protein n=1 Tax=Mycoplasmopsis californica TaxID=2113 RepID=A0A059XMC7_9BACT|nr:hypothetical protein [Mycoplasmopsis californica]AIA29669.1 hypothetical protein MCFN_02755 [Mycoplasmopsis californica]
MYINHQIQIPFEKTINDNIGKVINGLNENNKLLQESYDKAYLAIDKISELTTHEKLVYKQPIQLINDIKNIPDIDKIVHKAQELVKIK